MKSRAELAAESAYLSTDHSVPVDLEAVVRENNSRIYYEDLEEDISGMLLTSKKLNIILVNSNHHKNRQRFTIAHECGHLILHKQERELFVDSKGTAKMFYRNSESAKGKDAEEKEANEFASCLLMPASAVIEAVNSLSVDLDDEIAVKILASKFEVSIQAMSIRLTKLGLTH